jgi:hypothetical protein
VQRVALLGGATHGGFYQTCFDLWVTPKLSGMHGLPRCIPGGVTGHPLHRCHGIPWHPEVLLGSPSHPGIPRGTQGNLGAGRPDVLLGSPRYPWLPQCTFGYFEVPPGISGYSGVHQCTPGYRWVSLGALGCTGVHHCTPVSPGLPRCTSLYLGVLRCTRYLILSLGYLGVPGYA